MTVEEGGRWSTADNVFLIHHTGRGRFYSASLSPQGCVYETGHASDRASTHASRRPAFWNWFPPPALLKLGLSCYFCCSSVSHTSSSLSCLRLPLCHRSSGLQMGRNSGCQEVLLTPSHLTVSVRDL